MDHFQKELQQIRDGIDERIREFGHTFVGVFPTAEDPTPVTPFMYTVGLTAKGWPEIIATGNLSVRAMQWCLGAVVSTMEKEGADFRTGIRHDLFNFKCELRWVTSEELRMEYAVHATRLYGDNVRVLQLVWTDDQNRLPDEPGYDAQRFIQQVFPATDQ
ncbi:hypothetical protein [Ralstonia phage phiRSL1]|uniref:DUF4262 domain-containing protein n=1 Tax=Ralstonia phage phiRSL1 TaxID=1980924 RepID=B2ZXQ0_9CAUD|nr:hypothetical protein RSL1_ORF030 [Ralstonia phage phiRSL1]BAG41475.1 hypothetical protein [Ralstonia phage phiRSL1]